MLLQSSISANIGFSIMDQQHIIAALEARAKTVRVSISELCRLAGVHPTTFSRWKKSDLNPDPVEARMSSLNAIDRALSKLESPTTERAA
jgi:predicted transcriptional regulator